MSIILALLALSQLGCQPKKAKNEVSNEIVLKTGPVEITKYEFEKNKEREYQPGNGLNYTDWVNGFIDETYMLADADSKKYDTMSIINRQLNYVAQAMMSQVGGYLWERTVTPMFRLISPIKVK